MRVELKKLLTVTAKVYNITPAQMIGADRYLPIPEARAVFFYIAIKDLNFTAEDAAKALNKKRSNATQQSNKIAFRRRYYVELEDKVIQIREILTPELCNPHYLMAANLGGYEQTT
jgi:chromosomal replication initiation ATPase DnaA